MIGQSIGLEYLVPIALNKLEVDCLAEGDFYPGDLLVSVLSIRSDYWSTHPAQRALMRSIIQLNPDAFEKQHSVEDIMNQLRAQRSHWLEANGE